MKTRVKYLVMILGLLILAECKKEDNRISISGITETNPNAELIGNVDQTDWRIDDKWTEKEENLFQEVKSLTAQSYIKGVVPIVADTFKFSPAYPNPFKTTLTLTIVNNLTSGNLKIVFVNSDFKILKSGNLDLKVGTNIFSVDLADNSIFEPNNLYRIYYKIYMNNSEVRGHGDIKKIE